LITELLAVISGAPRRLCQ